MAVTATKLRTRIKFCGITSCEDALAAVAAGADALGFVFYSKSPRVVGLDQVAEICRILPPFVSRVGLFLDAEPEAIRAAVSRLPLDILQFHGQESPQACEAYGLPYMKALGVAGNAALAEQVQAYQSAAALLFDSHEVGAAGGTGQAFDWRLLPQTVNRPLVLAGGLKVSNVAEAVRQIRPYAVDVSSGVESSPGHKDPVLMQQFAAQVRLADSE